VRRGRENWLLYIGLFLWVILWAFWVGLWVMFLGGMTHTFGEDLCGVGYDVGHVGSVLCIYDDLKMCVFHGDVSRSFGATENT